MIKSASIEKQTIKTKLMASIAGIIACVVLPNIFHTIGNLTGSGAFLGTALLPMHLPVIFTGLLCGGTTGFLCGILGPVISFLISGMPSAAILPFMTIELSVYGLVAGLLKESSIPVIVKVLITQVLGRAARVLALCRFLYLSKGNLSGVSEGISFITNGALGIVLQLILLPCLMYGIDKINE